MIGVEITRLIMLPKLPRTDCPKCKEMWQHRLRLNQINDIIETELDKNPTDVLD